jgi:abortive infection bacteriophage resistance protein
MGIVFGNLPPTPVITDLNSNWRENRPFIFFLIFQLVINSEQKQGRNFNICTQIAQSGTENVHKATSSSP